jgi:hypothetical protein
MDRLTQEMTRRVWRAEKVACPGDDRCYAFPDPVNEVRGSRMPKGHCRIGGTRRVIVAKGTPGDCGLSGRDSRDVCSTPIPVRHDYGAGLNRRGNVAVERGNNSHRRPARPGSPYTMNTPSTSSSCSTSTRQTSPLCG